MKICCLYCLYVIEFVDVELFDEIFCLICGSSFGLIDGVVMIV